ncbi:hypothetical protein F5B21DRAFT_482372 [Xylaria acuta]|nr:hypothetical protein F5B21DRAFT_482372 [Xylaria acuta]
MKIRVYTSVSGSCLDHHIVFVVGAVPNFSLDFLILPLPILEIMKLHMKISQKIAFGAVFLTGAPASIGSIVRAILILGLSKQNADITCEKRPFSHSPNLPF